MAPSQEPTTQEAGTGRLVRRAESKKERAAFPGPWAADLGSATRSGRVAPAGLGKARPVSGPGTTSVGKRRNILT